jgi:hypothetical protein
VVKFTDIYKFGIKDRAQKQAHTNNKKAATKIFHEMKLNDVANDNQFIILHEYFEYHPKAIAKFGCGVAAFKMLKNAYNNSIHIIRLDGTIESISINFSLIENKKENIRTAFRFHSEYITNAKRQLVKFGTDICPLSGKKLEAHNTHIDHYDKDFVEMLNDFIVLENITIDNMLPKLKKFGVNYTITDEVLVNKFIAYHNQNCKLRAVNKTANLQRAKKLFIIN